MLSYHDALSTLLDPVRPVAEIEECSLLSCVGRVLAVSQQSSVNSPPLDNSAMDGYAVRAAEVMSVGTCLPVSQRIPAGTVGVSLQPGTAARIFTGAPIPDGADAVVMQERTEGTASGVVFQEIPRLGQNIRRAGEDIRAGDTLLQAGTVLSPQALGLAASAGLPVLPVYRRVRVGIFFTGDELTQPGEPLPPGGIYNSNRFALRALLEQLGCDVTDYGQVPDDLTATRHALRQAAVGHDLILTSGGVSVGEEDHVKPAVEAEGRIDLWKIAIKPGKPLAFGEVRRQGPDQPKNVAWFLGLPGNPVSAFVTFLMLVRPFILRLQGRSTVLPRAYPLICDSTWSKPDKRHEFLRARINDAGRLEIYPHQGSGVMTSLCWGSGLIENPPERRIAPGDVVRFIPFAELM